NRRGGPSPPRYRQYAQRRAAMTAADQGTRGVRCRLIAASTAHTTVGTPVTTSPSITARNQTGSLCHMKPSTTVLLTYHSRNVGGGRGFVKPVAAVVATSAAGCAGCAFLAGRCGDRRASAPRE